MSEEMLEALMELIDAKINEHLSEHIGRERTRAAMIVSEMKQDFIDVFIFGDEE